MSENPTSEIHSWQGPGVQLNEYETDPYLTKRVNNLSKCRFALEILKKI